MNEAFHRAPTGGFVFIKPGTPLTPDQTDAFLQYLNDELEASRVAVEQARNRLADCQANYKKAENRLLLSPYCPKVGRAMGMVTAAERDAWVSSQLIHEWEAVHFSEVHLANVTDYAWKLKDQVSLAQSLNNNAKVPFGGAR